MRWSAKEGWSVNPFQSLWERFTDDLEVHADKEQVARGDELRATVTIVDPSRLASAEMGLVCTESYAAESSDGKGGTRRTIVLAVAHETWAPVQCVEGEQTMRFRVPADAPFSYEGVVLGFHWEVVAKGVRKRRLDARATFDLVVTP